MFTLWKYRRRCYWFWGTYKSGEMYKSVKDEIIHVRVKFYKLLNRNASHHENKSFKRTYGNCDNLTAVCMFLFYIVNVTCMCYNTMRISNRLIQQVFSYVRTHDEENFGGWYRNTFSIMIIPMIPHYIIFL